jgi:hypothetical protein
MGKKKKEKIGGYASTTTDSGIWGSSTNNSKGTAYNAPDWMKSTMGTITGNLQPTIQNMLSNDYSNDANFQAYQNQLYDTMGQQYENMLGNMADRGLMRSSGMQAMNNSYAKALQDNVTSLYDDYYNRQSNNLANLLNTSNNLYNYMSGLNANSGTNSNNVNSYNMARTQYNNSIDTGQGALAGGLNGAMSGASAGSAFGPWGALGGAIIGGVGGALANK